MQKGTHQTEEAKAKISATRKARGYGCYNKGGYKHSEETKAKMSASAKAVKRKPHTEETKAKMSASAKARHAKNKGEA